MVLAALGEPIDDRTAGVTVPADVIDATRRSRADPAPVIEAGLPTGVGPARTPRGCAR